METIYQTKACCENCIYFHEWPYLGGIGMNCVKKPTCVKCVNGVIKNRNVKITDICKNWKIQPYRGKFRLIEKILLQASFDEWEANESLL